jgi:hypothetical protein
LRRIPEVLSIRIFLTGDAFTDRILSVTHSVPHTPPTETGRPCLEAK